MQHNAIMQCQGVGQVFIQKYSRRPLLFFFAYFFDTCIIFATGDNSHSVPKCLNNIPLKKKKSSKG